MGRPVDGTSLERFEEEDRVGAVVGAGVEAGALFLIFSGAGTALATVKTDEEARDDFGGGGGRRSARCLW